GTVFMVSHSAGTITRQCERALWIDDGRVVLDGPSEEVVEAYSTWHGRGREARGTAVRPGKTSAQGPATTPSRPTAPADLVSYDILTMSLGRSGVDDAEPEATLVVPTEADLEALATTFGRELHERKHAILAQR